MGPRRGRVALALVAGALVLAVVGVAAVVVAPRSAGKVAGPDAASAPIRIGVVLPLTGATATLAGQELLGIRIAADLVNQDGGVAGRRIRLDVRNLGSALDAPDAMASLHADGAAAVIGAYSSDLSIAASAAADAAGLVYWEGGAVADQVTGRGLPLVFRVGASGSDLGSNSARFAATQLAPRLGVAASALRVAIVSARDAYPVSVADATARTATALGMPVVDRTTYDVVLPNWPLVMADLKAAHPDVIMFASHIEDGIAFRQAMLAAGLTAKALIGTTMAQCDPDFAGDLGPDAVGVFASDRPTGGFQPDALDPAARSTYDRLAAAWATRGPVPVITPSAPDAEYALTGPDLAATPPGTPTEDGLSGFTAAWALFHVVLPAAVTSDGTASLDASAIGAAARAVDLPEGALPNGAGLKFSTDPETLGQNERAAAVIWQWQAVRTYTFVYPATYATGQIGFVPLER